MGADVGVATARVARSVGATVDAGIVVGALPPQDNATRTRLTAIVGILAILQAITVEFASLYPQLRTPRYVTRAANPKPLT